MVDDIGKLSIEVNGVSRSDIKVLSVDRYKGFMMLDQSLAPTDNIELNFYVDNSGYYKIDNLELNPKVTDSASLFHISGYLDGLGIALRPYDSGNSDTFYPYIYDSSIEKEDRTYRMIPPIGSASTTTNFSGMYDLCEININRLSTDMVKFTDARKSGGGIKDDKELLKQITSIQDFNIHELDWYTTKAQYGGEVLSKASNIIINVPSGVLFEGRTRWINSLSGVYADPRDAEEKGIKEFNFYLDQVIKRYISAGANYILIPIDSNGNFMDIVTLDY